jgi:hypothetical protein
MVLIVNAKNITTQKCNLRPLQAQRTKIVPQPTKPKISKEKLKAIEGTGFQELTECLKKLKVKDSMKNIRITM